MIKWLSFTDERALEALRSGGRQEDRAIRYLLDQNRGIIHHFVKSKGGSEEEAADVLQEGITEMIINIRKGSFRGESKLSTYLFAICKGIWYKKLTRKTRLEAYQAREKEESETAYEPQLQFIQAELGSMIRQTLQQIGESCQNVLEFWALKFSMEEIAEKMGYKNAQIAMNKKNKCLNKLKGLVAERPDLRAELKNFIA